MIQANGSRENARRRLTRDEFLASLGLKLRLIEITSSEHKSFSRAFELINKTNQFNTTGKRWTLEECLTAFAAGTKLYAFEVEDRFSQYGLAGVVIVCGGRIEQMVMSCRVVGLDVEIAAIVDILRLMRQSGVGLVTSCLVETEANLLCRTLFERCGFTAGDGNVWTSVPETVLKVPTHIGIAVVHGSRECGVRPHALPHLVS
jgi:FkbH-like protein